MIPYSRQCVEEDDIAAVADVLRSDWLTTGPAVESFENRLASIVGARHAVAFSNGTTALHGALVAAQIGSGDTVATTSLSFSASANAARYVGAEVSFVDVEAATLNLDPSSVPECDALVAVHFAGLPLRLERLNRRPRVVVEDAAQALGAIGRDGPVGNCARSDMTTFSFHPVKSITTGEGGAVTTNDDDLAHRLRSFRNHGLEPTPEFGGWSVDVKELGHNFRLSDIHAALGASQLTKLERFINARNRLAERYRELLADVAVLLPPEAPSGSRHAYHLFTIQVENRRHVYDLMRAGGIGVQVHHVPIHRLSIYRDLHADLPNVDSAYDRLLSLPLYPSLSTQQQDRVVEALGAAL